MLLDGAQESIPPQKESIPVLINSLQIRDVLFSCASSMGRIRIQIPDPRNDLKSRILVQLRPGLNHYAFRGRTLIILMPLGVHVMS